MDKGTVQQLCFVLGLLLFGALFMVSVTTWYIHEYRGELFCHGKTGKRRL